MLVLLGLIGLCIVLTASSVSAASTVYVNATGGSDSNNGTIDHPYQTIYQGISSVDENGTVKIADGVYTGTNNTNITITKNVNINGQSQTGTIINGTGTNWIFSIVSGVNVTITNLTLTNGYTDNYGGAIYNEGTLTLTNCTFTNNTAWDGGAIKNRGTITNLANCTFTNNTADYYGGAIRNEAIITNLANCTFTSNTADYYGGAIKNEGTITNLANCTFANNTAQDYGGAIDSGANDGIVSIGSLTGCTFTGNTAGGGGAIDNWYSTIGSLTGCIFTGNTASYYGNAIANWYTGSSISAHFNSFINNTGSSNTFYCYQAFTNATDNWWGTNTPDFDSLLTSDDGSFDVSSWLYMNITSDSNNLFNSGHTNVTVNFNNAYNGTTITSLNPANGHIPDGTLVNLSSALGTFSPVTTTTFNGIATALFTAKQTGTGNLTATTDNQTVTQLLTVNPASYLYLNTTTSKKNPTMGETFILTYKLSNSGPDNATNVTVSFQIPAGLEFVNATVDNGTVTYNPTNRTVTWTLSNVAVGDPYLYLSVRALGSGSYSITPMITSETFNRNNDPLTPFTVNVKAQNNSNTNTVNAASTTKTVPMQTTGMPIAGLILGILAVLGGVFTPMKK